MGKRKVKDRERIRRKIRRLERRLQSSSDDDYESDYDIRSVVTLVSSKPPDPEERTSNDVSEREEPEVTGQETGETALECLPPDILDALGEPKNKVETFAPSIKPEISERWGKIIVDGLNKETLEKLNDIKIPENFKLLKAPELNPEIGAVLSDSTKKRDKRMERMQNHLGKGIAAISSLMSTLISSDLNKTEIIKKLSEAGQLLLDLHCQNTSARRKLIMYGLDKKFSDMVQNVKRDSFLFGENLTDKIKANKSAEKSGLQIKRKFNPQPSTSYYQPPTNATGQGNSRGPPRTSAPRGRRGGARNQASSQSFRRPGMIERYTNSTKASSSSKPQVRKS